MTVFVCWRWVGTDARWGGVSDADRAALEIGLQLAAACQSEVQVVALGPPEAEVALREALAAGAHRVHRIDAPTSLTSAATATSIARLIAGLIAALTDPQAAWVVCGDYSTDRGSGSVPAFLAAELGAAQALGLVAVDTGRLPVTAVRRLDGGRREVLEIEAPAVLSVEGSVARLRRASLARELIAQQSEIMVTPGPSGPVEAPLTSGPYRPRTRVVPAPAGSSTLDRVRALTGGSSDERTHTETVELEPTAAARRILETLVEWGYLDPDGSRASSDPVA